VQCHGVRPPYWRIHAVCCRGKLATCPWCLVNSCWLNSSEGYSNPRNIVASNIVDDDEMVVPSTTLVSHPLILHGLRGRNPSMLFIFVKIICNLGS
jgi:hypothetical protein